MRSKDNRLIGRCLELAADGPFFPDCEFHTLFGLQREQVSRVAHFWPPVEDDEITRLAVNNALNNLAGYPHGMQQQLQAELGLIPEAIRALLRRWKREQLA